MPARFTSFPHLALGETGKQHVHVHFISFHHVLHHTSTASTFSQIHVPWAAHKNSGIFQCTLSGLPYPHLRVLGTDLWARCPDACIRRCIQCTNRTRSVTLKGTLSPTSTLAHRLVVIYQASSRLARNPKYPSHDARRPSHSAPHTRPTVCRMASI